jgi:hypothetical protein
MDQLEEATRELAKQTELWAGSIRYGLENAGVLTNVRLDWLHELNQLHIGAGLALYLSMGCDAIELIKKIIKEIEELGHKPPEEIKNRLLLVEAFNKEKTLPLSPSLPVIHGFKHTNSKKITNFQKLQ